MRNHHTTTLLLTLTLLLTTTLITPSTQSTDTTPPTILATTQSTTTIHPADTIQLCAQAKDNTALSWAYLQTNETGTWQTTNTWWNSHWTRRITITVDHTKVTGTLTNFPLLVKITNPDLTLHAQPNGADFTFTDPTNTIQYPHEIDTYDPGNNTLIAWVKIPRLSSTEDTPLYLYYGNPTCSGQQHINETWESYLTVLHFSHNLICRSPNGNRVLQSTGFKLFYDSERVGSCISESKRNNHLFDPYFPSYNSSYTISAWVRFNQFNFIKPIIKGNISNGFNIFLNINCQIVSIVQTSTGSSCCNSQNISILSGRWYSLYNRVNSEDKIQDLFINGNLSDSKIFTGNILAESKGLLIGFNYSNSNFLNGDLDELRICSRALNDAWITTENTMMTSPDSFISSSNPSSQNISSIPSNPIRFMETSESQWANFTWNNPQLIQDTTIGWRIVFQDTNGNQNQTPILSFNILGFTPPTPVGPKSAFTDSPVSFSVSHINENDLSFQVDYGDDNLSKWMPFDTEGHQTVIYNWIKPGTYEIRMRTQSSSGEISAWSPPLTIEITNKTYLSVSVPTAVVEENEFQVKVMAGSQPVAGAEVRFLGVVRTTNASGLVSFMAPSASHTDNYLVSSSLSGYEVNNETVIVTPSGTLQTFGWIYGSVVDASGIALRDVQLCASPSSGGMSRCSFSDDSGRYTIAVPPGTYTFAASKIGYEINRQFDVVVDAGSAVELNVVLSSASVVSHSGNQDLMEALIDAGVIAERIACRLDVDAADGYSFTSYDETLTASMVYRAEGTVVFSVDDADVSGAVIVARLADVQNGDDISVLVDGQGVPLVSVSDVMAADGHAAVYAKDVEVVGGRMVAYCLVYLPHFSRHVVEVRSVVQAVGLGGLFVVYLGVALVAAVVMVVPIVVVERRRR